MSAGNSGYPGSADEHRLAPCRRRREASDLLSVLENEHQIAYTTVMDTAQRVERGARCSLP